MSFGGHSRTGNITGGGSPTAAITEVGFRAENGATLEFNNLQVVPEPSTYAMLVAGGLTAFGAAVRRRRRQAALAL
jgi:lipid-binding SYLF domain-containing protein